MFAAKRSLLCLDELEGRTVQELCTTGLNGGLSKWTLVTVVGVERVVRWIGVLAVYELQKG
jgi:hypothetical protein